MAVIAITRQVATLADEVAALVAEKLKYRFIDKKIIEQKIVEQGFPEGKLKKYDEVKPGFFASLAKDRDEFLDYLQTAVISEAAEGNCVLVGRGSPFILENLPNLFAFRFVADDEVRIERLKKEFDWNDKQAENRINESNTNRTGFYRSFFNVDQNEPVHYHMTLNTGRFDREEAADIICYTVERFCTPAKEADGRKRLQELLLCQNIVNNLVFNHKININFLRAVVEDKKIILQGVADSAAMVEKALVITQKQNPNYTVESMISVVQDFKNYQ